jgi:uncharacterized protein (DUF433 family)
LEGTRIQPANLAVPVREGYTVEQVADLFAVTDETVRTAIEWYAKRSRRAPDAMFSSQKEHE